MEAFIKRYTDNPTNHELELRYAFSDNSLDFWLEAYRLCRQHYGDGASKLEHSIIILRQETNSNAWRRKEIAFDSKGVKVGETCMKKTRITDFTREINSVIVKMSLSEELPENCVSLNDASRARFRQRCSFIDPDGQWRTDFTLVFTVTQAHFMKIAMIKEALFVNAPVTTANWADRMREFVALENTLLKGVGIFSTELETEYVGSPGDLTSGALEDYVYNFLQLVDPRLTEVAALFALSKLLGRRPVRTLKQFANQPIVLDEATFVRDVLPRLHEFYLSDKADGERAILYESRLIFSDRSVNIGMVPAINLVLDCEVLEDDIGKFRLFYFDILYRGNENYADMNFVDRNKAMSELESEGKSSRHNVNWPDNVTAKKKIQVQMLEDGLGAAKQIADLHGRASKQYPIDGLIFTSAIGNYFDMFVYKWKPPELMTIDFLIMAIPDALVPKYQAMRPGLPIIGHTTALYALFCGIGAAQQRAAHIEEIEDYAAILGDLATMRRAATNFFPIQFSPPDDPTAFLVVLSKDLSNHVGEFIYKAGKWELLKMRPDKDRDVLTMSAFGNAYSTAYNVWKTYSNPFTLDRLLALVREPTTTQVPKSVSNVADVEYFSSTKSAAHKAITKYNAFVKAQLIRQLEGASLVVDLCAGKGQDMHTYSGFGIRNILMIDQDKAALVEAQSRLPSLTDRRFYVYAQMPRTPPIFYFIQADVNKPIDEMLELSAGGQLMRDIVPTEGAKGVAMNFALHYLELTPAKLAQFINTIKKLVAPGGIFIFTCFSGKRVFDLLKDKKQWDEPPYSIRRLYDDDKFIGGPSQAIELVHPFSAGQYYREYLVNIDVVIAAFVKEGFQYRQNGPFTDWMSKYAEYNSDMAKQLTDSDITYTGLYQYVSLYRPRIK